MAKKLTKYLMVMSGLMLLFHFGGLLQECDDGLCESKTPNSALLSLLLSPSEIQTNTLFSKIILIIEGIGLAGTIIVGIVARNVQLAVKSAIAIFLFNLLADFLTVFGIVAKENIVIALLFFGPIMILYVITIVEWWEGTD